ncbi:MAG: transcriptional repressor [Bryobacterales bacterium]|nr:transcriptional repressor [Bryobacterales bacterium]
MKRASSPRKLDVEEICREHALPLTAQRRIVLEALSSRSSHPTVDEIWEDARRSMPEISRTTVYRILETFARLGVVRKAGHPDAVARYESRTSRHHHLLCVRCGRMEDLDDESLDRIDLPGRETGYRIEDYSIQFRGLCAKCANAEGRRRAGNSGDKRRGKTR